MAGSDALLVSQDWISEHFFTSDATSQSFQARVLARRRSWDEGKAHGTTLSRFTQLRPWLLDRLATLGAPDEETGLIAAADGDLPELYARLRAVLGYDGVGLHLERTGPVLRVSAPGMTESAPLALVEAVATESVEALLHKDAATLLMPYDLDEATTLTSVTRTLSALFVSGDAPDYALVLAGRYLLVAEKARWAEGRYLAVDLQLVCERNDTRRAGEVDRALTCVAAESLAPDADGDVWWTGVLEESIKHTVGVSKDLREGVRLSIEILANEVVRRRTTHGLAPLPAERAQPLAIQSLRFLYRILFLLFAESSPELGVLPVGSPEYENGYSLDRLRELILVELATPQGQQGTHLYESLAVLFRLVDRDPAAAAADGAAPEGLEFRSLRADLFHPRATEHLDEVGLGNCALQQVLRHLLLSKEIRGKDRGFISYAELGINQLGAVYEGLMSYTGFFATEDLYEVAKDGDGSKGSWVVPVTSADGIASGDFIRTSDPVTGEERPVLHERGTFVFRLAGRDRQQSASYYTPEVLTRFVVSQALEELLDQDDHTTTASEILELTVCEPALGSGAFAIEAVRQLAEQYLRRRQDELDRRIEPDDYPRELQRVKAFLALHQVYGVDLNATAVELAEISLWLDTMVEGLDAPWFGLHLRRGNSLIGARRATFRRDQVTKKTWLRDAPVDAPLVTLADDLAAGRLAGAVGGRVHHFLLPAAGWGSATDAKEAKALSSDAQERLKVWRRSVTARPNPKQVEALVDLGYRVEALWQIGLRRLNIAEQEIRRAIPLWGAEIAVAGGEVQREQIEVALADADGAYRRLRRVMDAWCALWFWPLTDALTIREGLDGPSRVEPPTLDQWIDALQLLLGRHAGKGQGKGKPVQGTLVSGSRWAELGDYEALDLAFAGAIPVKDVLVKHPWLGLCEQVAARQGFFHWDLDFAPVFARDGFALQLGNPPWVRPDWNENTELSEFDPWWSLKEDSPSEEETTRRANTFMDTGVRSIYLDGLTQVVSTRAFLSEPTQYPELVGLRPDLYRCFMLQVWRHAAPQGISALLHPESHFTDEAASLLRGASYRRLRRHWQFKNELKLFDIDNHVSFGVHVYGRSANEVKFLQACSLYQPETVLRSLVHNGEGTEPGVKDAEGRWDVRPHASRVLEIEPRTLETWHALLEEDDASVAGPRMIYAVNRSVAGVLEAISSAHRVEDLSLSHSLGWDETADAKRGFFRKSWTRPVNWKDVVLQGPHLGVLAPFQKVPNPTLKSNRDWSTTDYEALSPDYIPASGFERLDHTARFDACFTHWNIDGRREPVRDHYRIAWRSMAAPTNERTLMPVIIPPGASHLTQNIYAAGLPTNLAALVSCAGWMGSLVADFMVRAAPKSSIPRSIVDRLPYMPHAVLDQHLRLRVLRLGCVTEAYSRLWEDVFHLKFLGMRWTGGIDHPRRREIGDVDNVWTVQSPLRVASDRRQAAVEIDALVALSLGLTPDELCSLYRTQFGVLFGYDRNAYFYDANGRLVPGLVLTTWRKKGIHMTASERTATNQAGNTYVYELPFVTLDREADMLAAYAYFERLLVERA